MFILPNQIEKIISADKQKLIFELLNGTARDINELIRKDVIKELKDRGIGSPSLFITDGLQGMPEPFRRCFPMQGSRDAACIFPVTYTRGSGRRTARRPRKTSGRYIRQMT